MDSLPPCPRCGASVPGTGDCVATRGEWCVVNQRLYLTADQRNLVREGDLRSAFQYLVPGDTLTPQDLDRYGQPLPLPKAPRRPRGRHPKFDPLNALIYAAGIRGAYRALQLSGRAEPSRELVAKALGVASQTFLDDLQRLEGHGFTWPDGFTASFSDRPF